VSESFPTLGGTKSAMCLSSRPWTNLVAPKAVEELAGSKAQVVGVMGNHDAIVLQGLQEKSAVARRHV
jgi:hypothetical protein